MTLEELKKKRALNLANNKKQTSSSLNEFDENRGVLAQALSNVDESGIQLLKDITTPIFHPIQTAKDLKNLGSSIINLIRPGEQGNEQLAKEVGNIFGVDKRGTYYDAYQMSDEQPPYHHHLQLLL